MASFPLVSIIIPVRDRFAWLKDCLQSVFDQGYPALEVIVVDDGSLTPAADFIVATWPERANQVTVIRNQESLGPGASRENGRMVAKGRYLSYLDSDDVITPQKISRQVDFLQAHPEYGMCYCAARVFSQLPLTGKEEEWRPVQTASDQILPQLLIHRPWGTGACLWTREATDAIGSWSSLRAGEDQEYEFRAGLLRVKIHRLPEDLFYVRRSAELGQLNQQNAACRLEDSKMYIAIGEMALNAQGGVDALTRYMISRHLVFSTIFLLSLPDRELALNSIGTVKRLAGKSIFAGAMADAVLLAIRSLPEKTAGKCIHFFRHRILQVLKRAII